MTLDLYTVAHALAGEVCAGQELPTAFRPNRSVNVLERSVPSQIQFSWRDDAAHLLFRDYETRGVLPLDKVGVHPYAAHAQTEVLCCAFAVDDQPVKLWTPDDAIPAEFREAAANPNWIVVAHNASFEIAIEELLLGSRYGWPLISLERQRCTLAMASALALPGKLEKLADVLELSRRKDVAGHRLMLAMSKPRRARKSENADAVHWFDDHERLQRLYAYCMADVEVERELFAHLQPLSPSEQTIWCLDACINSRGFYLDQQLTVAAKKLAAAAAPEIDTELAEVTGGGVTSVNQIARLQTWLCEQGCLVDNLDKKSVAALLKTKLPPQVQRVLELRQDGGQAAVKKIAAVLNRVGGDGRVRGSFQYHKASTGRWSGSGVQPQNLKRPEIEDIDAAIVAVMTGNYDHVRGLYPRILSLLGDLGRSLIRAAPGHVLIGADFSAIESRVLAWIAGEEWKLDAYRRFDATHDPGDEPYCLLAARMLHLPKGSVTPQTRERAYGKTGDLACGYAGGERAIEKFAPGVFSLEERERIKIEWRAAHPAVVKFWGAIDRAAKTAVKERGRAVVCGPVAFKCCGDFLFLKLPSGRKLAYPFARLKLTDPHHGVVVFHDNSEGQFSECRGGAGMYGGVWTENIVSGIARDLLAEVMLRIETAGYPIVLHVHDECLCEVSAGFGSSEEFTTLMTQRPSWAPDLPIAAKAWTGPRYCK
jgi:DNA polymerase bacteriophage-type